MNNGLEAALSRLRVIAAGGRVAINDDPDASLEGDLATVLAAFSTSPADDVREALASRLERSFGPFLAHWPHNPHRFFGGAVDEVMAAFEVRPRGTVTEAEVEAAAGAICRAAEGESLADVRMDMRAQYMREARAALEAAREARS